MDLIQKLSGEFSLLQEHVKNIITLLDEGNTVPFIARYRKEKTGAIDDQVLRELTDRLNYLRNLEKRKTEVVAAIEEQNKMTPEIMMALDRAETLAVVEDVYRPYKQKRQTRAGKAIEKGLQPLADLMMAGETERTDINAIAAEFINPEKEVNTAEDAIQGAMDIVAEAVSDNADIRKLIREEMWRSAVLATTLIPSEKSEVYSMYDDSKEQISKIPSHRVLAINRGENEKCLKVALEMDSSLVIDKIKAMYHKDGNVFAYQVNMAIEDSYDRLIFPSLEREIRSDLTDTASEQAIKMFKVNLKALLMQPPLKNKVVLGLDPAYRTGCKIAVIDGIGNLLEVTVIYPTPPQNRTEESIEILKRLIIKHKVDVIAIGNGTATKESEIFVVELIKRCPRKVEYIVVNEAGASVYSASPLGAEEFPDLTVEKRSAVSIARRLQDPLAELIKIDVKSIGVGQYQHDMPQKRLTEVLDGVVEDCVNSVGVDLNTASPSLLSHVAGLNMTIAKNIEAYRKNKPFESREELVKVSKLGPKAFEQCAGFLRIHGAKNVLDNSAVHPESYAVALQLLSESGYSLQDVENGEIGEIKNRIAAKGGMSRMAELCGTQLPTLTDIVEELLKPGRDIRDSLPPAILRSDLLSLEDLVPDMEIRGTVRNVIDFGAFVDIGVHQDGLVHISEISDRYISHPSDVLSVGDQVNVKVLSVDKVRKKISLSIKQASGNHLRTPIENSGNAQEGLAGRRNGGGAPARGKNGGRDQQRRPEQQPVSGDMDSMLAALQGKFGGDKKKK